MASSTVIFAFLTLTLAHSQHGADQMRQVSCSNDIQDQIAGGGALTQTRSRRHWQHLAAQQHQTQQLAEVTPVAPSEDPIQADSLKPLGNEPHLQSMTNSPAANKTAFFQTYSSRTFTYSSGPLIGASGSILGGFLGGVIGGLAASGWLSQTGRAIAGITFGAITGGFTGWVIDNCVLPALLLGHEVDPVNITAQEVSLDEPLFEKMRHFAEEVIAITNFEHNNSNAFTEFAGYFADAEQSRKALQHIIKMEEEDMEKGSEEPSAEESPTSLQQTGLNGSRKPSRYHSLLPDYEKLVEMVAHGHTADFLASAKVAKMNQAILTDQDIAWMQNGYRGEDEGPHNSSTEQLNVAEGDMVLPPESYHEGHKDPAGRPWPGARVKYCFAPDVPKRIRSIFEVAAAQYSKAVPCLDFVNVGWKRGNSTSIMADQECRESPAIFVMSNPAEGCYSWVGVMPSMLSQRLQLQDPGCFSLGIALHEIGHALGMAHEHSRPDRDDHIRVFWDNIQSDAKVEFEPVTGAHVLAPYDLMSVMLLDNYAFAAEPSKATLEAIEQSTHDAMGQRNGLSPGNMKQVAHMYLGQNPQCTYMSISESEIGCINTPNADGPDGEDMCTSLTQCGHDEIQKCCACGGGIKVQCYKGSPCPEVQNYTQPEASSCLEDATHLYPDRYACVHRNVCNFEVSFKCPSMPCKHEVKALDIGVSYCGDDMQTEICKGMCDVERVS